ncbi:MAG: prepilin-type N-terminal cleavage/methylation domain-containing protein [Coxiellaceae bacterium]|nr:prepilin-type N-terminal cleavage/methylation domain-containing protein [Coxiellaceae bacterium]
MQRQSGFTLIEMMLVIAVVAVLASLGLMAYHRHAQTARIDKVSLEMQHVLEAALAYDVDNGKWPEPNKEATCVSKQPADAFVDSYIPNQDAQSSYGSYFCWSSAGENSNGDARLFWVAFKLPVSAEAKTLGYRIAARLPNAILTSDLSRVDAVACGAGDCYVRAEVVQPAATSNNQGNGGMIVATGDCPTNKNVSANQESSTCSFKSYGGGTRYDITFNACPGKDLARVTAFPNFIHYPVNSFPGFTVEEITASRTSKACTTFTDDDGQLKQRCEILVKATTCTGHGPNKCVYKDITDLPTKGSIGASYVVACIPDDKKN